MDLHSIQNNIANLVAHDLVRPPARQLSDAVDATDKDKQRGGEHSRAEDLEITALDERRGFGGEGVLAARQLEHVKSDKHVEAREGDDLEDDAGEHDVAAHVGDLGGVGRRGDTAADGLQQEREEVAGDEDIGVQTGPMSENCGPTARTMCLSVR